MVAIQAKAGDMCLLEENVLRGFGRMCYVYGGEEECSHLFFKCSFTQVIWASQKTSPVNLSLAEAFWRSLTGGTYWREVEEGRLFSEI